MFRQIFCRTRPQWLFGILWLCIAPINLAFAEVLTTAKAVEKTLRFSPALQQFPYQQRALEADALQAGLNPNPVLQADLENVFGSGNSRFLAGAELTLSLSQLIEMGDKRQQRIDVANAQVPVLQQQYEVQRMDVVAETLRDYYQALRLDAMLAWNQSRITEQQTAVDVIQRRARAGVVGDADVLRMQLRLSRAENRHQQLRNERELAYQKLAANWLGEVDFTELSGKLAVLPHLPDFSQLVSAIEQTPQYLRVQALSRLRTAQIALAEANAVADITVGAGIRRMEATNDNALVFSFSMPLQINNPNQGNIARANAMYEQELQEVALTNNQVIMALREIHMAMTNNTALVTALKTNLQPVAESLLASTAKGYELGQYGVLQWVDAQTELFAVERDIIEAQTAVHLQYLELERLSGNSLNSQMTNQE